ncbi:lipoprotein [Streptomyces sp. NPDC058955]|uniref:lipoprotein n=1 Tax=unclassified Streptomyces TaxID=2593676 RepID=UPI003657C9F4
MPVRAPLLRTALLAAALLTACGTTPEPAAPAAAPTAAPSSEASAAAAVPAGTLGRPGSACTLPVSFTLTKGWKPKKVTPPADPDFAELVEQGPATVVCEVDSEDTPDIGFLRVWTAPKGKARATLEAFVKADDGTKGLVLKDTTAGGLPVVEAHYTSHSELLDEERAERSLAVVTAKAVIVLELGGLDADEEAVVAAYELAKSSLALT